MTKILIFQTLSIKEFDINNALGCDKFAVIYYQIIEMKILYNIEKFSLFNNMEK